MTTNKPASVGTLPVLALRNLVLFPGVVLPVDVGRPGSLKLVEDVIRRQPARLLIATQKDPQIEEPSPEDLWPIAVEAEILKVVRLSDQRVTVVLRGLERRLGEGTKDRPLFSNGFGTGRLWRNFPFG